jgi:serine protease AprX
MMHTFLFLPGATLVAVVLLPAMATAKTFETTKLDKTLRESMERGCIGTQSVIITVVSGYREALRRTLASHGDVVTGEFPAIDAIAATLHCADLTTLAGFGSVRAVSTNAIVGVNVINEKEAANENRVTTVRLEHGVKALAREHEGELARDLTKNELATLCAPAPATMPGHGIGVAVIDSGIEPGTDFDNRVTAFYDFTGGDIRAVAPHDDYGHGTHVAGLIGSEFVGVAPHARLIGLKVLNALGQGTTDNVVRAIEFAVTNRRLLGINVLNLSLGHPIFEHAATDPLVQAVEHAARVGLTVVVAAGNFGANPRTGDAGYAGIVSPANAPSAVTAGAVNTFATVTRDDDRVAPYSSRGPSWYDGLAKPDIVAPGHKLLSVAANDSTLRRLQTQRGKNGNYMRLSGTSMAAAVTSGVVAVVLQAEYRLTPNALKAVLEYTSIPVSNVDGERYGPLSQGAGQIQADGALTLARLVNPRAVAGGGWLAGEFTPSTIIGTKAYTWSQSIIWGNYRIAGTQLLSEQRPAWATNIVWGERLGSEDDNIVWGNSFDDGDDIVWGNVFDDDDNIVWGNNVI